MVTDIAVLEDSKYYIISQICKNFRSQTNKILDEINLYSGQEMLLNELWKSEGRTQTDLAEQLNVSPATITKMISRMKEKDLIEKEKDSKDSRVSRISLSEKGKDLRTKIIQVTEELENEMLRGFDEEEMEKLDEFLSKLNANLEEAREE